MGSKEEKTKKIFIFVLLVVFLLSAFGCGKTNISDSVKVISPDVQTKITNLEQLQTGKVTYKRVQIDVFGGQITAFTLSYKNPKRMYVALKDGEIYKTEDLGNTWEKIAKLSLPPQDPCCPCEYLFEIESITESLDGKIIYLITTVGIFKSENYGKTFTDLEDTLPLTFVPGSIIVSKDNPDLIIITGSNGTTSNRTTFRSSDGGVTWVPIKQTFDSVMYNYATNELYATDINDLFRSTDFGRSWKKLGGDFHYIESFSVSQTNPTVIVANTQDGANTQNLLYISKDSGKSFKNLSLPFPISPPKCCINPKDTNFIALLPQYASTFSQAKLIISKDGGASFKDFQIFNTIRDAQFSFDGSKLFMLTSEGVLYSWDGGNSFTIESVFPEVYFENIVVYNNKGFVLTNGTSFKVDFANGGAVVLNKDGLDYLVNAAISEKDTSYVYASSWARLFMLEGNTLKPTKDIEFLQELLISPNDPSVLFAKICGGDEGRTLTYASYDCGKTLEALPRTEQHYSIIALTFDPQNPSIIYAIGSEDDGTCLYLYKSEDNGKSFTKISENFIVYNPVDIMSISMFDSSIYIYGESSGIFKSDDLGKTFKAFDKGIGKIPNIGIVNLEFNPKTKDLFLLTKSHGLFMLKNGSNTWVDISYSLPKDKISALAVDKKTGRVFIGVNGIGIFELIQ